MKQLILGMVSLSVACSGRVAASEARCERADQLGVFLVSFERLEGTCSDAPPVDERVDMSTLDEVGACKRLVDDWSLDNCTRRQVVSCDGIEIDTELTTQPDGSLVGTEARSLSNEHCHSRYRVRWLRQ
jgi:hypothetical protein